MMKVWKRMETTDEVHRMAVEKRLKTNVELWQEGRDS
jgi:predicted HTH domain antitoxin